MTTDDQNKIFKLAYGFVNDTNSHIYLTGKAGTGKTTFLRYVKMNCEKNLVVVAPTGVAAINAGGVTMHSFFQLPFNPYIPHAQTGFGMNANVVDKNTLLKNIRFNSQKRKLLEELQLLIIDEVSMLRADMLDAIDTILRSFRRNQRPFGGVQMLFIGDLYQLPPVVTDNDKDLFDQHYTSPFFFHAKVFEQTKPLFVELKKIYRQTEETFIDLLNKVRHNRLEYDDFELLNERYKPNFKGEANQYITLTSHNFKADKINEHELNVLNARIHEFKGEIKNDFGEKQLPTEMILRLKEGAQVMFIKNDSSPEKKYYNGKIVIIHKINNDEITVKFPDTGELLVLEKETWDNVSYELNTEKNEIEEKILGQFIQYPLRLAWAITIHKSQGLTFEKAIIDAGYSFAAGQVYVALSRCTSLEGLVLHSPITAMSIHSDQRISEFGRNELQENELEQKLYEDRKLFQVERLQRLFQWTKMIDAAQELHDETMAVTAITDKSEASAFCKTIINKTKEQKEISHKFQSELQALMNEMLISDDATKLLQRMEKAIEYFARIIYDDLIMPLSKFMEGLQNRSRLRTYFAKVQEIDMIWWHKINELQKASFNGQLIAKKLKPYAKEEAVKIIVPPKVKKGDSSKDSLIYYQSGKTIEEIATIRKLAQSTIEGHLSEYIITGELGIETFLNPTQIQKIKETYESSTDATTKVIKEKLNDEFTYGQLRMAVNYLLFKKEISLIGKLTPLPKK